MKRYPCPECPKAFRYLGWANRHLIRVHGYRHWDHKEVFKPSERIKDE